MVRTRCRRGPQSLAHYFPALGRAQHLVHGRCSTNICRMNDLETSGRVLYSLNLILDSTLWGSFSCPGGPPMTQTLRFAESLSLGELPFHACLWQPSSLQWPGGHLHSASSPTAFQPPRMNDPAKSAVFAPSRPHFDLIRPNLK